MAYRLTSTTEWALFDDAKVTPISLDTVLQRIQSKKGALILSIASDTFSWISPCHPITCGLVESYGVLSAQAITW